MDEWIKACIAFPVKNVYQQNVQKALLQNLQAVYITSSGIWINNTWHGPKHAIKLIMNKYEDFE